MNAQISDIIIDDEIYLMEPNTGEVSSYSDWESERTSWETGLDESDYRTQKDFIEAVLGQQQAQFDSLIEVVWCYKTNYWKEK